VADATLRLALTEGAADPSNPAVTERLSDSVGDLAAWRTGQVRRAVYHLPTSPRLTAGQATVQLTLIGEAGDEHTITLPPVVLAQRARQYTIPAKTDVIPATADVIPATADVIPAKAGTPAGPTVDARFGNPPAVGLIGFDLPDRPVRPDSELAVTLYWQALAEMDANYTVFIQILSADWRVVAQQDHMPLDGAAPTTTWLVGEYLTDPYRLQVPAGLASGQYRVITGLYDASTGQRLPVSSGGRDSRVSGDFFELGTVDVAEADSP
jgi:hypothetical protein